MNKSKKLILVIISIISCLVIVSVPCFALNEASLETTDLYSYNQLNTVLKYPTIMRMYTMGFDSNKNNYVFPYSDSKFRLNNLTPGTNSRLGLVFYFNNDVIGPRDDWIIPHKSNTYSFYSEGFYSIEFNLYLSPSSGGSLHLLDANDISLNGYRSNRSTPSTFDLGTDDLQPVPPDSDKLFQSFSSLIYQSDIQFVNYVHFATDSIERVWRQYHIRLIVPAIFGLYTFDTSFKFPEYYVDGHMFFDYDIQVSSVNIVYGENATDIEGFFYIPDFKHNFDSIEDTEEFFNDNLSDSLDNFKNIGNELISYLDGNGGLLSAFAVWNVYIEDIFNIKPIRILLIFSIIIGLFTFVVSSSNLFIGVVNSAKSKFNHNKNNKER